MSQLFPRNKGKRRNSSASEATTSFVKNVTSRVSGLLPTTLTKWFSSPSSSNANGSAPMAEGSDWSDDEAPDNPVVTQQPPAKRMRFNAPTTYNHYGPSSPSEPSCSISDVEILEIPYSTYSGTQYAQSNRNTFAPPMRSINENQDKNEGESATAFKIPHTVSNIGQSVANKRRSIFDTTTNEEASRVIAKSSTNTERDPKQPCFKASLLGSPFYPGRTMYGGAASSYINQPNIKQQTVAVVNESKINDDTAISSASRRIMDLLDSYSSPLMDARRIPLYTKPKNVGFNTSDRPSPTNKTLSYKTQELHVPSIASILRLKKKSRLMDTTNVARQIIASHSSASSYPAYPSPPKGTESEKEHTNKITTRISRTNRGNQDDLEVATPVKLPTATLQLDADKLPQFSFSATPISKLPAATSTPKNTYPTADKKLTQISTCKLELVHSSSFKFSNPVRVSCDDTPNWDTPPKFTFDIPESRIDQKFESKPLYCDSSVVVGVVKEPEKTVQSKDWQCPDCWVSNKPEANKCVCCGFKQTSQNANANKCTVCKLADCSQQKDKCVNCEKMSSQLISPTTKSATVSQSSTWKCEVCWVSNEDSADKCVCCAGSRSKQSSSAPATVSVTSNTTAAASKVDTFASKSEPIISNANSDWKCADCWILNKSSVDKCAACGGARPGAKPSTTVDAPISRTTFFGSTDNTFKTLVKVQKSETWECPSCLVRNDSVKEECICCGQEKESNKKNKPELKFNFGTVANNSFKFGIDPKVQEATIAKKTEVIPAPEAKAKDQSETNNNVLAETPTFTFTLPSKKLENKTEVSKANTEEAPKMMFSFGIPKASPTSTAVANKLQDSNKNMEEEKPQEVPSVDLNVPVQEKPIVKLSMPAEPQISNENKILPSSTLINPLATGTKNDISNSIALPATSETKETPKPTFSFSAKPNTKLFEPPASTGSPVVLFGQSSQATSLQTTSLQTTSLQTTSLQTTTSPSMSLFNPPAVSTSTTTLFTQPDLSTKPGVFFQSSESMNNAAPAPTPIFSFGNSGPSNSAQPGGLSLPAPETPKFQFTFGSNLNTKTDPPALFKSPFGTTENILSKPFSLPVGTTLGSSNTLTGNTLGGSNEMSASNGLTGNNLGGMQGNAISGNTLTIGNMSTLGGTNGISTNPVAGGSSLQTGNTLTGGATSLFGNANVQKDNVWSPSSNAPTQNLFVSNNATNNLQKATFTFGSSTPFNNPNNTPAFGSNPTSPPNIFGIGNQNNSAQPSIFSNTVQSPPTGNLFGSPQPPSNPTQQMPLFGNSSIGATPTFGASNQSIPTFEAPSLTPAPTPAFNFGASQSTGIFGFGQQPQLQQQHMQPQQLQHQPSPQQTGVYSFGGAPAGAPHVQFSMGSGANPAVRRVRKAVRRNPQR